MAKFTALSGPELKKYILTKIEEALDKTDKFGNHLSHPWVKYEFELKMGTYPQQDKEDDPKILVSIAAEEKDGDITSAEIINDVMKNSGIIDTPDKARIETNQPIPTQTKGPGDVFVDKPVQAGVAKFPGRKGER